LSPWSSWREPDDCRPRFTKTLRPVVTICAIRVVNVDPDRCHSGEVPSGAPLARQGDGRSRTRIAFESSVHINVKESRK